MSGLVSGAPTPSSEHPVQPTWPVGLGKPSCDEKVSPLRVAKVKHFLELMSEGED